MTSDVSKTVEYMGEDIFIESIEAHQSEGELVVSKVRVEGVELEVGEVPWSNIEDGIMGALLLKLRESRSVNTCVEEYPDPTQIKPRDTRHNVLLELYRFGPTTNPILKDRMGKKSVSGIIANLKRDGLAQCIGKVGKTHINMVTPEGAFELFCVHGPPSPGAKDRLDFGGEKGSLNRIVDFSERRASNQNDQEEESEEEEEEGEIEEADAS